MTEPKDRLNLNEPVLRVGRRSAYLDIDKTTPYLETLDVSWSVFDVGTSDVQQFDAFGGHFKSVPGHRYLVFLRVSDLKGVQRIALGGSGMLRCATDANSAGTSYESALPLEVKTPQQEFINTAVAPLLQDLVVVMQPDLGAFDYFRLSGGFRHLQGTSGRLEYFALSGVMTFFGGAGNSRGDVRYASLTTSP